MRHEFGHVLQYLKHGVNAYYGIIAPESAASAIFNSIEQHFHFWTESYANYLSFNYFKPQIVKGVIPLWNFKEYPVKNINLFNLFRLNIAKSLHIF